MANCMSVLHDLEQHPTSLFSSLLNGVSIDGLSCSTWCHHLLPSLSTKSLLHCDRRPPLGGRTRLVYINIFLNFSCWFHTAPIGFNGKPIANTVCMYATYAYANLFEIQKQSACGAVYSMWSKHLIWQISKWLLFHKKKCYWFLIQILRV